MTSLDPPARNGPAERARGRCLRFAWIPAIAMVLVILPLTSAAAPTARLVYEPSSWSNGVVLCEFAPSTAEVAVSALARDDSGLTAAAGTMTEYSILGTAMASANMSDATWTASNESNATAYAVQYTSTMSVLGPALPSTLLGTVQIGVEFVLPFAATNASPDVDTVAIHVSITGWPWQILGDHLEMSIASWPAYDTEEHLALGSSAGALLSGVSVATGAVQELLFGSTTATADPGSPSAAAVAATPSVSGNSTAATVAVDFGSSAGSYGSLDYSMGVDVLPPLAAPSALAGIPPAYFAASGAAAVLVAGLVAVTAQRARSRTSRLTYVDEEEP